MDISGETNEYYELLAKEINYNIEIEGKQYSSNENLILVELPYYEEDGIKKQSNLLLFIENETSDYFYESLYQLLKKLNDELQKFVFDKSGWRILGNLIDIYNLENIVLFIM